MAVIKKYIYYWHVLVPSQACCDVVIPDRDFPICFLPDLLCWTQTAVGHVLSQPRINFIEFINFVPFVHKHSQWILLLENNLLKAKAMG